MKRNRIFSWVLASVLVLSLSAPAAQAAFPDVPANHWAAKYIDDMTKKGVFVGIDGKFMPDNTISASEVLATCARMSVEAELRTEIGKARATQITGLMGTNQSWFHTEYATCLEAGILSYAELKELYSSKALTKPITKEDFAFYLVRALQMEPMAQSLTNYTLTFTDKAAITPGREAYVYLLNRYNIITGTDVGTFEPKSLVNRAVASTMLSRAIAFMEERGTSIEIANYTDYEWEAGTITAIAEGSKGATLLTLASDLSGSKTVSVPAETPIYENSMTAEKSRLKTGVYARVCMDTNGAPISVRLSGSVQTVTGNVLGISESELLLTVNGTAKTVGYDRFTEVQVGKKTGDRALLDFDAGYTTAVCRIDQLGNLVAVQLSGGTRKEDALISSVEPLASGGATLVVCGFDGQMQRLSVPAGAAITANGLTVSAFSTSHIGSFVSLRVSNDDGSVSAAAIDTVTRYIQGAVKTLGSDSGVDTITINNLTTNKATTYKVATGATFRYNGDPVTYGGIQRDWFATVKLAGNEIATLEAYPGSTTTTGFISSITFPTGTTREIISVTKADGVVVPFELNLADPPSVLRSGKSGSLDKLRTGDAVTVTVRYSTVTMIDAVPQSANLRGTIEEVKQTTSGVTLKVTLDSSGGSGIYTVTGGASISQNGKTISMFDLRAGYHIAMVASGDQVASIEVDKGFSNTNQLTGTIILTNTADKTILFRAVDATGGERIVTVSVPSNATIQEVSGSVTWLSKLATGDRLDIYGADENGTFKATIIIRK